LQAGSISGGRWREAEGFGLAQRADPSQFVTVATEFPVYAVAPSWGAEGDPGASVELLWSPDGVTWDGPLWIARSWHGGLPDRENRNIGNLVSLPGASFLQYRTYDAAGNFTALPGFELDYLEPTPGPTLEQVANPALTPAVAPPPVISRAAWGADESLRFGADGRETWPVAYQPVEHVIIHHADTANFNDPVLEMRSIYYFHTITRGWGDIAYNYLIDFMGNVYEGRVGGENAVGGHAEGYNAGSCGICLMGRFFEDGATPEMHAGVVWAASWAARNFDPSSSAQFYDIPDLPAICGHRNVNNTSCPGDEFYAQLEAIRSEISRVVTGREVPELPPPEWTPGTRVLMSADGASLYEKPGYEFPVSSPVPPGAPMEIIDGPTTNDGENWYYVEGPPLWGWIPGNVLSLDPNPQPFSPPADIATDPPASPEGTGSSPDESDTSPTDVGGGEDRGRRGRGRGRRRQDAWPVFAAGTPVMVIGGELNLRVEPGLGATILTGLPDGYVAIVQDGPFDADGIAWYQVVTADNVTGWCDGSFLQPV
jgi:hypothetical protein